MRAKERKSNSETKKPSIFLQYAWLFTYEEEMLTFERKNVNRYKE
jgi:hypothetical protein